MKLFRLLSIAAACAVPALALAQWQWVDKTGRKVFSDQPPPPDIPAASILKQPGARVITAAPPPEAAKPPAPKVAGKDPALEDKRKRAEAAEALKKQEEAEKYAAARADNCKRARQAKSTFDSGTRIMRTNEQGEREFLGDKERAAENKRIQETIDRNCGPAD